MRFSTLRFFLIGYAHQNVFNVVDSGFVSTWLAWLECGTVGFLVEMWNGDVFIAVTGGVPAVLRLIWQVTGIVQPLVTCPVTHHPNSCLFSLTPFLPFPSDGSLLSPSDGSLLSWGI
jgi:hypothetical protein